MKKFNLYSQIVLVLSFLVVPMSFFSVVDEMKVFRATSLLVIIGIFILGVISLKQIKNTNTKGRGYVITSLIISAISFLFLILMSLATD
jgi:hypothetical protein